MPSSETLPSPEPESELELQQPPLPHISEHTGGGPAMDMTTMSGVGETKKGTCCKCADCLACKKKKTGE